MGDDRVVAQSRPAQPAEQADQPVDRADQTQERRDANNDFQHDDAPLHLRDFVARPGLDGVRIFALGPTEMFHRHQQQPAQGRRLLLADPVQHAQILFGAAEVQRLFHFGRDDLLPPQRQAALDDEGQADNGGRHQQ